MIALIFLLSSGCVTAKRANQSEARTTLGHAYFTEGSTELAIETLQEATRLDRRNSRAWHYLALSLVKRGAHEEAEDAFKKALRLSPDDAAIRLNYAYLLQKLGRNADAIEQLEAARADLTYTQPAKVLNNLGMAYLAEERVDESVAVLSEAVYRQPNFCAARYNLGLALSVQEQAATSAKVLDELGVVCPGEFPEGELLRGQMLMQMGRMEEGAMVLQVCLDNYPGTPVAQAAGEALDQAGMR